MMMKGRFLWGRPFSVWRAWPEATRSVWNHLRCREVALVLAARGREVVARGALRVGLASAMLPSRQAWLPKVRARAEWEKEVQFNVLVLPRN